MTIMAATQMTVKIAQISKDLNIKSKDVLDAFKGFGIEKKSGGTLDGEEFEIFLDHITKANQIKDLEAYRSGKTKLTVQREAPATEEEARSGGEKACGSHSREARGEKACGSRSHTRSR